MRERIWLKQYDEGVPEHIDIPDVALFRFFENAAEKYPDQACTVFQDTVVSYGQMNRLADRLAAGLERMGLHAGDRVGLALPNIPQFVLAYYAILKMGGVVVAINPLYKQRELEFMVRDAGVRVLIGLESGQELYQQVREKSVLESILLTNLGDAVGLAEWASEGQGCLRVGQDGRLKDALAEPGASPSAQVGGADTAVFQYSGGTTGTPKAAVATHRNLVANSLMFRKWLVGLHEGQEASLIVIPLYHVYGMVVGMSVSVLLGAKMVLISDARQMDDLLRNIERYQTSFFPGVPTLYALINQNPDVQAGKYDLRCIRACISGSAPLLKAVQERFEALTGAKLMEGYGLSEAPTATHCNPMYGEKRSGSIGLPLPDVDCRIVSLEDEHTDLPTSEAGELLIRSPQVMKGYFNDPEETALALRDGWLYTGDIARMDEDGYFYIIDRKKDLIKVGGFQVWPREVEEVIAAHPQVQEVGVARIPDEVRGEVPKAWVVLRAGQIGTEETANELREWCEASLVYYKVPAAFEFVQSLPRSGVGKLLRRELTRLHTK